MCRSLWLTAADVNLNHGSYGSPPKPVVEAMRKLSDQIESCPDLYMRRTYIPELVKVQDQVADLIGADRDEVVITPNATHAINNIVREIEWEKGDIIVMCRLRLGCEATLTYRQHHVRRSRANAQVHMRQASRRETARDRPDLPDRSLGDRRPDGGDLCAVQPGGDPSLQRHKQSHAIVQGKLHQGQDVCRGPDRQSAGVSSLGLRLVALADPDSAIIPWEDIVRSCKKYGVLSLVDAAHAIGQVKTDVKASDPDFWVSVSSRPFHPGNGPDSLRTATSGSYGTTIGMSILSTTDIPSHRGCAVLYVPVRYAICSYTV